MGVTVPVVSKVTDRSTDGTKLVIQARLQTWQNINPCDHGTRLGKNYSFELPFPVFPSHYDLWLRIVGTVVQKVVFSSSVQKSMITHTFLLATLPPGLQHSLRMGTLLMDDVTGPILWYFNVVSSSLVYFSSHCSLMSPTLQLFHLLSLSASSTVVTAPSPIWPFLVLGIPHLSHHLCQRWRTCGLPDVVALQFPLVTASKGKYCMRDHGNCVSRTSEELLPSYILPLAWSF